ncbi:MAG: hypothetical protein FJX72_22165, partial [Armatimonadetes bacterium]|nr:hypothetical protein [Armatimonadota bacterium]
MLLADGTTFAQQTGSGAPPNPAAALQKAYTDASRMKDPEAKIKALQKVAEQAPAALFSINLMARGSALTTMCKAFPAQTERIQAEIDAMLQVRATAAIHLIIAKTLLNQNVMLPVAEELARKGLTTFEEEAAASTAADRAKFKSALALVFMKNGKVAEGDALLKEVAALDALPAFDAPTGMG